MSLAAEMAKLVAEKHAADVKTFVEGLVPKLKERIKEAATQGVSSIEFDLNKDLGFDGIYSKEDYLTRLKTTGLQTALHALGFTSDLLMEHVCGLHDECHNCRYRHLIVAWE